MTEDYKKFENLTFKDFKLLATDEKLSSFEKIGFPRSYREGYENLIFEDIKNKVSALKSDNKTILDIGPGCSQLSLTFIEWCEKRHHRLLLIDSKEMLSQLPDKPFIEKYPYQFPNCEEWIQKQKGKIDGILVYSVMQHIFLESNPLIFIDKALTLLSEEGELLLGDLPNVSKRKRFFSSNKGIETHKKFTGKDEPPKVEFMQLDEEKIDDGFIFAVMQRYRNSGFEAYLLPQDKNLPLSSRREDILIVKR